MKLTEADIKLHVVSQCILYCTVRHKVEHTYKIVDVLQGQAFLVFSKMYEFFRNLQRLSSFGKPIKQYTQCLFNFQERHIAHYILLIPLQNKECKLSTKHFVLLVAH